MSTTAAATAIKNTLVFLMLVLLVHAFLREFIPLRRDQEQGEREKGNAEANPYNQTVNTAPPVITIHSQNERERGVQQESSAGSPAAASHVPKELLDYVFGTGGGAPAVAAAAPTSVKRIPAPAPNNDALLSSMTGGEVSPGVFAFDGSESPYSSTFSTI